MEVAPAIRICKSEITALAAATLALEMLYIQAAKKGRVSNQMRCARVNVPLMSDAA